MAEQRCFGVEVTNIRYTATAVDVQRVLTPLIPGLCSISYTPRSGKAIVELESQSQVEAAIRALSTVREIAYSPAGQSRTLRAHAHASGASSAFTQSEAPSRWPFYDGSSLSGDDQEARNLADLEGLFSKLAHGGMKDSIRDAVMQKQQDDGLTLKEMYLAYGRKCELVFSGSRAQKDTVVLRSAEVVEQQHLDEFHSLFKDLPPTARRTGIDKTLHRISRSVHAIHKRTTAITARVGRTIQGSVMPMLVDTTAAHPLEALAELCQRGVMLIGQPNVGKTTVLRELARLLSASNKRVVVIVDKSLEIAGTGVIPHEAIGNARVLTVERPEDQDKVMIEAVENQSPDIIVVDELSNREQCNAARTIAGRGVAIIATVHGDGLASLLTDHDRSLLIGGVASVTLSAREAEARSDKLRQVSRRCGQPVFGAAVELRGYYDWIVHEDLASAVDKYLDYVPFPAVWRVRQPAAGLPPMANEEICPHEIVSTPVLGCHQQGSTLGFAYAHLRPGERLPTSEQGVDFQATDPASGQRTWTEVGVSSRVYERTQRTSVRPQGPGRAAASTTSFPFSFGGVGTRAASEGMAVDAE